MSATSVGWWRVTVVDGRTRRGERNREAIIDALIACYDDGILRPSVQEVADRAGVSARSVHNHFVDVEALRAEVAQRQWERCSPLRGRARSRRCPFAERVEQLVEQRAALFEEVTPVRRAALLSVDESPTIAANLARLDRTLAAPARARVRRRRPTCSTRSTRSRRGTRGIACAARRAAASPAPAGFSPALFAHSSKEPRDERDQTEQGPVRRAHGGARRRARS